MVSTRGVRYKFSEGERVLCYEPDPTKAKVLYDSKVLEVIETKDKRGRRTVEYLIHFQGWNSSWDRCVSEDFVLKDTEENRQLQRDLAEKSQLQLGAYLYRRERKKGGSTTTSAGGAVKRPRRGFSDDGSSSSTQPDEGETADTESSSGEGSGSQSRSPPPTAQGGRAHIALPSALRDRLTFDYHLVVKRGRLASLPASPCAAEILEAFVKWFARAGAWHPARGRNDPPHKPDLLDVSCRLNLVREVADGLRVYFDFVLRGHLLYKQELEQYHEFCGKPADNVADMKPNSDKVITRGQQEAPLSSANEMKSPNVPPPPTHSPHNPHGPHVEHNKGNSPTTPELNNHVEAQKVESERTPAKLETLEGHNHAPPAGRARSALRSGHLARRLRSHKSLACEPEEPAPSTSAAEPRQLENLSSSVGSSGSSLSEAGWARPTQARANSPPPAATRTPLSLLLDKVANWEIIPREGTRHLPCRVYGAVHLARLFVKLPDFLTATHMSDFKLKLILKHIDMFIQFLDEHQEWYDEKYYIEEDATTT